MIEKIEIILRQEPKVVLPITAVCITNTPMQERKAVSIPTKFNSIYVWMCLDQKS